MHVEGTVAIDAPRDRVRAFVEGTTARMMARPSIA
jgi:hypothetical protein